MLFAGAHRRLISEMVSPELAAISKALERHDDQVVISPHTAQLLDVYQAACGKDLGVTLTREQALERLVQVFVGNPIAIREAREAAKGAANG